MLDCVYDHTAAEGGTLSSDCFAHLFCTRFYHFVSSCVAKIDWWLWPDTGQTHLRLMMSQPVGTSCLCVAAAAISAVFWISAFLFCTPV